VENTDYQTFSNRTWLKLKIDCIHENLLTDIVKVVQPSTYQR